MDDGSTDDTPRVVQSFLAGRQGWRLLRRPEPSSPGAARNAGVGQAHGELLFFLDGDDLFLPPHLAACWRAMRDGQVRLRQVGRASGRPGPRRLARPHRTHARHQPGREAVLPRRRRRLPGLPPVPARGRSHGARGRRVRDRRGSGVQPAAGGPVPGRQGRRGDGAVRPASRQRLRPAVREVPQAQGHAPGDPRRGRGVPAGPGRGHRAEAAGGAAKGRAGGGFGGGLVGAVGGAGGAAIGRVATCGGGVPAGAGGRIGERRAVAVAGGVAARPGASCGGRGRLRAGGAAAAGGRRRLRRGGVGLGVAGPPRRGREALPPGVAVASRRRRGDGPAGRAAGRGGAAGRGRRRCCVGPWS